MFKKLPTICMLFIFLTVFAAAKAESNYKPDEVIVRFKPKAAGWRRTKTEKQEILTSLNAGTVKHTTKLIPDVSLVKLPEGVTVEDAISKLKTTGDILYVEPNYKIKILSTFPNDTRFDELWGLNDYGQLGKGYTGGNSNIPLRVLSGQQDPCDPNSFLHDIVAIDSGWDHLLALEKNDPQDANYNGFVWARGKLFFNCGFFA